MKSTFSLIVSFILYAYVSCQTTLSYQAQRSTICKGEVLYRALTQVRSQLDQDNNRLISSEEFQADLRRNYKLDFLTNDNDCVSARDFVARFTSLGFSSGFANDRLQKLRQRSPMGSCDGLLISSFTSTSNTNNYLRSIVRDLMSYCNPSSSTFRSDRTCQQLPGLCRNTEFACFEGCQTYIFVTLDGQRLPATCDYSDKDFGDMLAINFNLNDPNGDNIVSADEVNFDLQNRFDVNRDNCVTKEEFFARMTLAVCGGFGASDIYAQGRWAGLAANGPPQGCPANSIGAAVPPQFAVPKLGFLNANINTTVIGCNSSPNRRMIRDCNTIYQACKDRRYDFKDTDICKQVVNDRRYKPASRSSFPFRGGFF